MPVSRLPWLAGVLTLLLAALWAGLIRLGWAWPPLLAPLPMSHGPLMIGGFLGVVIGIERAVGLDSRPALLAPALAGVGALLTATGLGGVAGPLLITLGSLVLVVAGAAIVRIQPALFTAVIASGAVAWAVGNLLWLGGRPVPNVVLWWMGFLVLTIAGERLELSRLLRLSRGVRALFLVIVLVMVAGMVQATVDFTAGVRVTGVAWLLLAGWLLRFDIARRRVRAGGQARYVALALIAGYGWLAVGGLLALTHNGAMAGPRYDALLHAVAVGFVFSMIFAHAPIIVPAVLRVDFLYHPRLYAPLALLHLSLALRILGDLLLWWPARLWGGLLGALAILFFLVLVITAVRRRAAVAAPPRVVPHAVL